MLPTKRLLIGLKRVGSLNHDPRRVQAAYRQSMRALGLSRTVYERKITTVTDADLALHYLVTTHYHHANASDKQAVERILWRWALRAAFDNDALDFGDPVFDAAYAVAMAGEFMLVREIVHGTSSATQ